MTIVMASIAFPLASGPFGWLMDNVLGLGGQMILGILLVVMLFYWIRVKSIASLIGTWAGRFVFAGVVLGALLLVGWVQGIAVDRVVSDLGSLFQAGIDLARNIPDGWIPDY